MVGEGGYPLDDSWIHQTIARNLAQRGEWSINPGEPAAVSTSPLWTVLLSVGHLLGIPTPWTLVLGALCLCWTAWETRSLGGLLFPDDPLVARLAPWFIVFEWQLAWAALSGMETLLFTALSLAALRRVVAGGSAWKTGLLVGLLTVTRPEGLLLGALAGARSLSRGQAGEALRFACTVTALLVPAAVLNLVVGGSPLPSTFYAKNAAYAGAGASIRFVADAVVELARGPLLVVYPGLLYVLYSLSLRERARVRVTAFAFPLLWVLGLSLVYALWLPALYHHGRYLMPLLPVLLLYGLAGSRLLLQRWSFRLLPRVAAALAVAVLAVSWLRGAQVYGENVTYVNGQQVALARWFRDRTPEGSLVATHDIGALGYFSGRPLVDIAGLATPELRTATKDVPKVMEVLERRGVTHVAVLPDWYPPLTQALLRDRSFRPAGLDAVFLHNDAFVVLERVPRH